MPESRRTRTAPEELLRDSRYLRLWLTGALLGTTRWLEVLGLGLWSLAETGSPLVVALMLFARTLPMPLLGVPMGALADKVDRRVLLAAGVAASAVTAAVLLGLALAGWLTPWHAAIGAFVNGTMWTMEHPVRRPLIADVVGVSRIGVAFSLDSATFNATRMAGPLLGGAAYALLGLTGIYALAVTFQSAVLVLLLGLAGASRPRRRGTGSDEPFREAITGGFAEIRSRPVLGGVMAVTVIANLLGFSYAATVPVIGERALALDPVGIGVLVSMEGLGAFAGALALAFVVRPALYRRTFVGGAALFLAMVLAFARTDAAAAAMLSLFVAGLGVAAFGAMQSTIVISVAAPSTRARVMGVLVVCIGAGPPGILLVGTLADSLGAQTALTVTASIGLAGVALAALAWPSLRRRAPAPGRDG